MFGLCRQIRQTVGRRRCALNKSKRNEAVWLSNEGTMAAATGTAPQGALMVGAMHRNGL